MRNVIVAAVIFILAAGVMYLFITKQDQHTGYVFTSKLFESYKGTKELTNKVQGQQNRYKLMLDSLKLEITMKSSGALDPSKQKEVEGLKTRYNALAEEVVQYNEQFVQNEQGKIWTQLNSHVKTYGEEHHYSIIYGANGTGNIMYADSSLNITTNVLEYANAKYDGK